MKSSKREEDDAMDLNDEGVRLATKAAKAQGGSTSVEITGSGNIGQAWTTWYEGIARAAITAYWPFYLRAAPERSDEPTDDKRPLWGSYATAKWDAEHPDEAAGGE